MSRESEIAREARLLETAENRAARQTAASYTQARRELVDYLLQAWTGPEAMLPRDAVDLWRRLGLIHNIDARLKQLSAEVGQDLNGVVTNASEVAMEGIERQMKLLPPELRPDLKQFTAIDTKMVEQFVPTAVNDIAGLNNATSAALNSGFQNGLIQGESFPNLVARLMASVPTGEGTAVWRRGEVSAELMTRRTVITANNGAKQEALRQINSRGGVQVQKQAMAVVSPETTDCCLRVNGQIQDVDKPFKLTGTPRFADEMMHPAFHWNCRTSTAMYHPLFERGALTTKSIRADSQAELKRRDTSGNRGKTL